MKVSLIEGVGFGEQSQLLNELSLYSIDARSYDLDQPFSPDFKAQMEAVDCVIFRARWSATVEENVFIKMLIKKHQPYFEVLDELLSAKKIKIIGVGRGSLLWLEWLKFTKKVESTFAWEPEGFLTSSWIDTKVHTRSQTTISIRALVSGRAFLNRFNLGAAAVRPWVEYQDRAVGWIINDGLYLSLVDVFSLSERAQLPDYGYEDLSMISTRSNLVQMILAGTM